MPKNKLKINTGFTLIETIIYIGLFVLILSGALTSVYSILEANARNQTKIMVQEEGAFLLGKIDWALTGVVSASVDATGKILTTIKSDSAFNNPIVISIDSAGDIFIKRGTNVTEGLNNSNVTVGCEVNGCFERVLATGDGINPESVSADIIVNANTPDGFPYAQYFSTIKFIR